MVGEFIPPLSPLYLSPCFPTDMTTTWSKGTSGTSIAPNFTLWRPRKIQLAAWKYSNSCGSMSTYIRVLIFIMIVLIRTPPPPPGSPTQLFRGFKGCWCKGILKMIPKEFLGNHQSPTRVKFYIQWNLKDVSTQFPGTHQISTPVKHYNIQGNVQGV